MLLSRILLFLTRGPVKAIVHYWLFVGCTTEEDIWSSRWGLKEKLDASVQVMPEEKEGSWKGKPTKASMPFEIKTGVSKGGLEHRAQTMLYTILMKE